MKVLKNKVLLITLSIIVLILLISATSRFNMYLEVTTEDVYFKAMDGAKIHAVIYKKAGSTDKMPAVIVVHGFSESQASMTAISTELARHGVVVMALDYRGHGDSEGGLDYIGDPLLSPNITNDLIVAYQNLISRADVDASRIGLIGHSMGSRAVLSFASFNPKIISTIMLGPYYVWEADLVNTSNPKNLLIIVGKNDIITPPNLGIELFSRGTGYAGVIGEIYGNFTDGTARKLVIVKDADHYTILSNKQVLKEILEWEYNSLELDGTPDIKVDPSIASAGLIINYLMLILIFPVISLTIGLLKSRFSPGEEVSLDFKWYIRLFIISIGVLVYTYAAYFYFPIIVEIGWKSYQMFILSGAQYTFYYFFYLVMLILILLLIYALMIVLAKKVTLEILLNTVKKRIFGGLILGVFVSLIVFITVFICINLAFTGVTGDYLLTLSRWTVFIYFVVLLFPLLLVDELFLRYVIQSNIITNRKAIKIGVTIVIEYLIRIIPLMMWFMLATNMPALVDVIYKYYEAGLISDVDIVTAFLPMNSYALYYSFSSIELIHATSASYIFEETKNILSSTLIRALTLAFTMAAVMPFL